MEAKELQIGDYFFVKRKNKIGVVREIDTIDCYIWCGETYGSVYSDRYKYDDIEPISLTPYILEKNSFGFNSSKCFIVGSDKTVPFCVLYSKNLDGCIELLTELCGFKVTIKYIHELQHVLRLCGLNELADNFKI